MTVRLNWEFSPAAEKGGREHGRETFRDVKINAEVKNPPGGSFRSGECIE